jgi:hypothetical protein
VVYGETEEERDSPWFVRAESSNQLLHTVLLAAGAQPDSLIPEDTFTFDATALDEMPIPPLLTSQEQEAYLMAGGSTGDVASGSSIERIYPSYEGGGEAAASVGAMDIDLTTGSSLDGAVGQASCIGGSVGSSGVGGSQVEVQELGLYNGMTDEQLAEYLSSTYS